MLPALTEDRIVALHYISLVAAVVRRGSRVMEACLCHVVVVLVNFRISSEVKVNQDS